LLVEIVLGLTRDLNVSVRLDLGQLWAMLVVVSVTVAALWASVFHGYLYWLNEATGNRELQLTRPRRGEHGFT
jgi:hypothetical protein